AIIVVWTVSKDTESDLIRATRAARSPASTRPPWVEAGTLWPGRRTRTSLRSVTVGGSVRPRTLERRVSSARPARSSSGERLIGCQAAPNWTVRRSAALLCPPTQIGGYGFCSGLGSKTSPLNCVFLPVNDGSLLVQSSRILSRYSSAITPPSAKRTPT